MCLPFNKHRVNLTNINGVYKNSKVGFGALLISGGTVWGFSY